MAFSVFTVRIVMQPCSGRSCPGGRYWTASSKPSTKIWCEPESPTASSVIVAPFKPSGARSALVRLAEFVALSSLDQSFQQEPGQLVG